jgi:GTPase
VYHRYNDINFNFYTLMSDQQAVPEPKATSTKAGFVAIIGEPNVGKSTLLNVMLKTKLSIVTPKPQTTRRNVLGIYTDGTAATGGTQIVFYDTPGVLTPGYELQRSMMEAVKTSIEGADALLVVVDILKLLDKARGTPGGRKRSTKRIADQPTPDALYTLTRKLEMSLAEAGKPIVVVLNKMDALFDKTLALPVMDELMKTGFIAHVAAISALENKFVDEMLDVLKSHIPPHEFYYDEDELSTQPQRFFVAELIREVIFMKYREEIPYSTEVSVIEFKEREEGKWYISAEIVVERTTQKQILIGKGASALKETGAEARKAIEAYLEMPIFLELFVKVREDWRNNGAHLRSFGYL